MIKLHFDKLYNVERNQEHCSIGIPIAKGDIFDCNTISIMDETNQCVPIQANATSYWDDGSIRWVFLRFLADLPANAKKEYYCSLHKKSDSNPKKNHSIDNLYYQNDVLSFELSTKKNELFKQISFQGSTFSSDYIEGPILTDDSKTTYDYQIEEWSTLEYGPLCAKLQGHGYHLNHGEKTYQFEITITCYHDKPWFELAYRIINTTNHPLTITNLSLKHSNKSYQSIKTTVAISNYKTDYQTSEDGLPITKIVDAKLLQNEANEHNPEVFYGTFFADCTNESSGLAITIFQAQQNFPKALTASKDGIHVMLVPSMTSPITMQSGMAREQHILFHFHTATERIEDINHRSTLYQMPDKPLLTPETFKEANVFEDVFVTKPLFQYEIFLTSKADEHSRCYGMLNWGDSADLGYTSQGRGHGRLVWTNNEYDFPHACALMYARTGTRRFLDYNLVAARHWMDIDICHYSDDPLIKGGQWMHTHGHILEGSIVCSHEWVEGLLDYYHFTGEIRALKSAIGIGENVLRLLDTPMYQKSGALNARETGWALRTLVALYKETHDLRWLEKCEFIVGQFKEWEDKYGHWLSPYLDNTSIRVTFMISIAVGSLMRYYRIRPSKEIKGMILRSVDDLIENARLDNGLFYYKELPSLDRLGNNPIILEALCIAYELTGNSDYLVAGLPTLQYVTASKAGVSSGGKEIIEDTVRTKAPGTKNFAQLMLPVTSFYKAAAHEGLL